MKRSQIFIALFKKVDYLQIDFTKFSESSLALQSHILKMSDMNGPSCWTLYKKCEMYFLYII